MSGTRIVEAIKEHTKNSDMYLNHSPHEGKDLYDICKCSYEDDYNPCGYAYNGTSKY